MKFLAVHPGPLMYTKFICDSNRSVSRSWQPACSSSGTPGVSHRFASGSRNSIRPAPHEYLEARGRGFSAVIIWRMFRKSWTLRN